MADDGLDPGSVPIDALLFPPFREACGWGCEYELRVRMLADKTEGIEEAFSERLEAVEDKITGHFRAHLSEQEVQLLATIRVLRNKLLHADFTKARAQLKKLGHDPGPAVSFAKLPDRITVEGFVAAAEKASPLDVEAKSAEGSVFGWFLQLRADGSIEVASAAFRAGIRIVNRLAIVPQPAAPKPG